MMARWRKLGTGERAARLFAALLITCCAGFAGAAHGQSAAEAARLTLHQAVAMALQNSPDLKLARMQYNVAMGEVGVDRAQFRPNLYTGSGAAYTYGFPGLPGSAPAVFQLSYTQSIFDPLAKGQQHAAEERAKNMKLEEDRVQDSVIAQTATAYLELAKVRHSLELLGSEQASAEKIIDVTRERVQANQELPIEETRSELALAEVHERMVKLDSRDEILTQQLRDLTGIAASASLEVDTQEQALTTNIGEQADSQIVSLALQNDRSIAEAENDRKARQELLRGAKLNYFPTVELVGQYSVLSKFNNYSEFYRNFQRNSVNAGIQLTIPIFSAKTSANASLAQSQLLASELTLGNKRTEVRNAARRQERDLRELEATREVARLALKLAQQTLDVEQSKLDQGQATLGDVEQSRLDEGEKWVEFLDADFAQQKAQISLLQATGQLAKVFQ
jgi:outer membrane protein